MKISFQMNRFKMEDQETWPPLVPATAEELAYMEATEPHAYSDRCFITYVSKGTIKFAIAYFAMPDQQWWGGMDEEFEDVTGWSPLAEAAAEAEKLGLMGLDSAVAS